MKYLYTSTGKLFGEIKYSKEIFTSYKKHFHSMFSLSFVEKGMIRIEYAKDTHIILDHNSIAIFNPNQSHCTQNINAIGYYTLYLNYDWCMNIQKELFLENQIYIPVDKYIINNQQISTISMNIYNDLLANNNSYEKELKSIIKKIFKKDCKVKNTYLINDTQHIVNLIQDYIYAHLSEQLSTEDIANYFGYDKSYLIRLFKKKIGITPQNFIINERVHKAKELFKRYEYSTLLELALDVGFYDQSHFNRNFKKIFATNPGHYMMT